MLLLLSAVLAAKPADDDIAKEINEAIDNDMQLEGAQRATQTTFADLKPFLGEANKEHWESKTIADIRGMSQNKMAVSTVSDNEMNFARDTEEAKDVVDQTNQMAQMKITEEKQSAADKIKAQLAQAQASLRAASETNAQLGESDDAVTALLEESEKPEDFSADLYSGSPMEVQNDVQAAISNQVSSDLGKVSPNANIENGLTSFAKDAEKAAAEIENMKAQLQTPTALPQINVDTQELQEQAERDEHEDSDLGDAQEKAKVAKETLSASDNIARMLAAAQANLDKAGRTKETLSASDSTAQMLAAAQANLDKAQQHP